MGRTDNGNTTGGKRKKYIICEIGVEGEVSHLYHLAHFDLYCILMIHNFTL